MSDYEIPMDMRSALLADVVVQEINEKTMLDIMDKKARRHFRHWKRLKPLLTALRAVLLMLCILAKPSWCIELGSAIDAQCEEGSDGTIYYKSVVPFLQIESVGL